MNLKEGIQQRLCAIQEVCDKIGFDYLIDNNAINIYVDGELLFVYEADYNRVSKKGTKTFSLKLNKYTYVAYLRKCLMTEKAKIKKLKSEENKERFTSCKYGNKAYAVFDNEAAKMVIHYRSEWLAKKKIMELRSIFDSKNDIIKILKDHNYNADLAPESLNDMAEEIMDLLYANTKKQDANKRTVDKVVSNIKNK